MRGFVRTILILGAFCACVAVPVHAQDFQTDADSVPEWYVAPEIPVALRAPKHESGSACILDSVITFNFDSVVIGGTYYSYDEKGRAIKQESWIYTDSTRVGNSKKEYSFDDYGNQVGTAVYAWDETTNDWRGTSRYEYVYDAKHRMLSNTSFVWVESAWAADKKYTYAYDEKGRETEYYSYQRNEQTNEILPTNGRVNHWFTDELKTQEIVYTAYSNGAWSGGTRKDWAYDADSTIVEYAYYPTITNGEWVGSSKEVWAYDSGNKTLYEKYGWAGGWVGTSKETWAFSDGKKTMHEKFAWADGGWIGSEKELWGYTGTNTTYYEKQVWTNGAYVGSVKEEWTYVSGKKTMHEKFAWANGGWIGSEKEIWEYTGTNTTYYEKQVWANGAYVGSEKEEWTYVSGKLKLHEKYARIDGAWSITLQENTSYDAAGNKDAIENYTIADGVWTGTKKEEYFFNASKAKIATITYQWTENGWVPATKNEVGYQDGAMQVTAANYTWDGTAWVGDGQRTGTIYTGGKLSVEVTFAWSAVAGEWVNSTRRAYAYDSKERPVGDTTQHFINGQWVNAALQTHGYDAHDNDTLAVTASWNGAEWKPTLIKKGTFLYTASDDPLLFETYSGLPNAWVGTMKKEWAYNGAGRQTLYQVYEWKSGGWANKQKTEQAYIADTLLVLNQSYTWKNKGWEGTDKFEYAYDEYGRQCMSANYIWSNNDWYGIGKTEQTMDADGVVLSTTSYSWGANGWEVMFKNSFTYNANGKPIKKLVERLRSNGWVNYKLFEYGYVDFIKEEVSTIESRWVGGKWQMIALHAKEYDESDHKIRAEKTGSWDTSTGEVVSYTRDYYEYACDYTFYTICFNDEDGSLLLSISAPDKRVPTYTGEIPTKAADAQYTYTFAGWNPELGVVTGDATYTATYSTTVNQYTVTFYDEDGNTVLDSREWNYGATPTCDEPTKEATEQYTYTFAGWNPELGVVTGDATYTATYSTTVNQYTVTFYDEDGSTVLDSREWAYGATPTCDEPTKEASEQYTYTFAGWDSEVVAVTGDATYTATYNNTVNQYTVTFYDEDGSTVLDSREWNYGATPTCEQPSKEATDQYTYTFAGWEPEIVPVVDDATYTAKFDSTKNSYTVTWLNEDGTEIEHETLEYGATPTHADIDKESTYDYTYTFTGWEPEITPVTGDATYTATFDSVANVHTIYYRITVTADDAAHGEAGFVFADAASATLLTDSVVASGTWIELRATAADDWHFEQWSDGDTHPVRAIEVTSDAQYIASFAPNCGDYASLPVVILYDWLMMLDLRSIHAMGYTFGEEDITWYRVHGEPDQQGEGAGADDERLGTGSSFTIDQSLVNSGDYYATVDVSNSPAGVLCTGMMRSQIVHYTSSGAAASPVLEPALVRPHQPQRVLLLNPDAPTTVRIYDISGHLLHTMAEDGAEWMSLQAEGVAGCYQVVVQNGDQRTVLRYIVVQ